MILLPFFYGSTNTVVAAQTMQMTRWRGFDNPFGYISTILDGIIVDTNVINHPNNMSYVYTCQDASKYADTLNDSYVKVGEEISNDGYTKSFDLGDAAHIIPHDKRGTHTTYMCGYSWTGYKNKILRTLIMCGRAGIDASTGIVGLDSCNDISIVWASFGFRTVSAFMSFFLDK